MELVQAVTGCQKNQFNGTDFQFMELPQHYIGGVSGVNKKTSESENDGEGENAADGGCRYPRRSNRTNIYFKRRVDA